MKLGEALSVLSKSSPFSVATQTDRPKDEYDQLKDYLYIEQEIEHDFRALLKKSQPNQLLFLCGSSGDGKSEILTRAYREFSDRVDFHLDATHGFQPHQTAVEALDRVFDAHKANSRPLAVGINVGMMSNYASEGSDNHSALRAAIRGFVSEGQNDPSNTYIFLDFESFPKFEFDEKDVWKAPFPAAFLRRLTQATETNPFHRLAKQTTNTEAERRIKTNFQLLSQPAVRRYINRLLFRSRLEYDQFMTARALLDFIYHLVTGPGSLADNLFSDADNDLSHKVSAFDPAECHSKAIDLFSITSRLGPYSVELQKFIASAEEFGLYLQPDTQPTPVTLLRFFAMCKEIDLGNNFHHKFRKDFCDADGAFDRYARVWLLHSTDERFNRNKGESIKFYIEEFIPAIQAYANRRAPWLSKSQFYLQELNGVVISANFTLKQPQVLERIDRNRTTWFRATVLADNQAHSLDVSLPLFNLLTEIQKGYRPTRYDKNTTVMLDDFISRLAKQAKASCKLLFSRPELPDVEVEKLDEDYFQMEIHA